jgi:Domain of unknown function (DUF4349)
MNRHEMTVEELTAELHGLRELPSEQFASRLDARAAAGFPSRRPGANLLDRLPGGEAASRVVDRFRAASPPRKLLPALTAATTVIVVATAIVVATDHNGGASTAPTTPLVSNEPGGSAAVGARTAGEGPQAEAAGPAASTSAPGSRATATAAPAIPPVSGAPGVRDRRVERSAELTLGTDPEHVQDVASKVFDVVGRYRGIVLSSSIRDGAEGEAGARFELLIPSRRLSGALADLSGVAEVRSRSENTLDITAPFVSARERLRDARAEAEGLLRQLAAADTEAERASVKAQLRIVRGRIAAFRSQVDRLERRADFSRVSLQIATGEEAVVPGAGGDDWSIGDALHDAGRILAVAAGVALIALAVTLPLALLGGAAWAGRRIYLRRAREQALRPS